MLDELKIELVQLEDEKLLHGGELCQQGEISCPGRQAYYHRNMKRLSFKLPGALRRRVSANARRNCADLAAKLVGSVRGGPRDASTNKRYLDEAILADYLKRPRKRRRSRAIQDGVAEKLARIERSRLAAECAKLDPEFEKALADEGLGRELDSRSD